MSKIADANPAAILEALRQEGRDEVAAVAQGLLDGVQAQLDEARKALSGFNKAQVTVDSEATNSEQASVVGVRTRVKNIPGIKPELAKALQDAGYTTLAAIRNTSDEKMLEAGLLQREINSARRTLLKLGYKSPKKR